MKRIEWKEGIYQRKQNYIYLISFIIKSVGKRRGDKLLQPPHWAL